MSRSSSLRQKIKILIVDDHAVVRQGTRDLLLTNPDFEVVGELETGENLTGLIRLKQPDVLLLDINLPGKNGLDLLKDIRDEVPELKIILFTAHTELQYIRKGVALKTDGYLSKTVSEKELQGAVYAVMEHPNVPIYSPDVANKLNDASPNGIEGPSLTAREHEILLQVAQGLTNRDIADTLILSVKTVDSHVANLMKKLGVNNRAQLTAYAYENGLL